MKRLNDILEWTFVMIGMALLIILICGIGAIVFMVCWNVIAPVFGLPNIQLIHALCMVILLSFLHGAIIKK